MSPSSIVLAVGALVVVTALVWFTNRQMGVVLHTIREHQPPASPSPRASLEEVKYLHDRADAADKRIDDLTRAVADGIDHVDRNEKRVRGIVTGARKRFANEGYEDAGVEAEFSTLPEPDGGGGGEEELRLLQNDVEVNESDPWAGVPGHMGRTE